MMEKMLLLMRKKMKVKMKGRGGIGRSLERRVPTMSFAGHCSGYRDPS